MFGTSRTARSHLRAVPRVNLIRCPYTRARRVRRQAEPHRPRLRRAERPARAAWAAQRLLVDVAISV